MEAIPQNITESNSGDTRKLEIRKLLSQGMNLETVALHSEESIEFVESCIEESFQSEYCVVYYRPELNAVFLKWKKFCCREDYRNPLRYSIELMKKYNCINYIGDTRNGFEDIDEDIQWAFEKFIPDLAQTSCRRIVFLVAEMCNIEGELDKFTKEFMKYFTVSKYTSIQKVAEELS
jgi:hypothetical protein